MKFRFYNSLYFLALILYSPWALFFLMVSQTNEKSFHLTRKRKTFFPVSSFQGGGLCVKRSVQFLQPPGSLASTEMSSHLLSVLGILCLGTLISLAWLVWCQAALMLMTTQPATVPGGEIPMFCILRYLALWSTGPPRLGIVEREWGRSLQLLSLLHSAVCRTLPRCPQPPPGDMVLHYSNVTVDILPWQRVCILPRLFQVNRSIDFQCSWIQSNLLIYHFSLVSRSHLKVAGCESGGILPPFLTFFSFSDSLQDWETCFFSWGGNSLWPMLCSDLFCSKFWFIRKW